MNELSVIISTNGKVEQLRACLEALCLQTQPAADFEVIVVVNDSTDATSEMLTNLSTPFRLYVIRQRTCGQGVACNRGVEAAAGRYCLFLDDDMVAYPKLVAEHLQIQRTREGVIGIGQVILRLAPHAGAFARYILQERRDRYAQLNRGQRPSCMDCGIGNLSAPRTAILESGGFAVDLPGSETIELGYRLERQGLSFVYIPDATAYQDYHKGFCAITAAAERAGLASVELYKRHPPMLRQLQLGAFYDMSRIAILLRRLLLTIRVPIRMLAIVSLLVGKHPWARERHRFLHSYSYWRGVRRAVLDDDTWQRLTRSPVILMYHALGGTGEFASRYVIPKRRFSLQMAWLKWRRYPVLSLEEFLLHREAYRLAPARSVIITFDDGYADNRTLAYEILRQYGFPATIFLVSGGIEGTNRWDSDGELAGRSLLSYSDIRDMLHGGVRFGAHTRSHVPLTTVTASRVTDEVEGSRADLEHELGLPILAFAYPHGEYNPAIQAIVERAGFLGACSCHTGVNDPMVASHALRRIEVRGTDSLIQFALALWLGISARSHSYGRADGHATVEPGIGTSPHEESIEGMPSAAKGDGREENCKPERGHCYP